jgi:uncharacterized membrane protein YbaN (DUF454 family)
MRVFAASRWLYLVIAYVCVGLAAAGVLLPGLPTTPFLLVAAWAAARGSKRLHRWLYRQRHFGPLLRDWEEQGAVSAGAKKTALIMLAISWVILAWLSEGPLVPVLTGTLFVAVASFLLTRPAPRVHGEESSHD